MFIIYPPPSLFVLFVCFLVVFIYILICTLYHTNALRSLCTFMCVTSLSITLSLSLSLSFSLSLCACLCLSPSPSLFLSLSPFVSLSVSLSLSFSLSLSLCVCLSLSLSRGSIELRFMWKFVYLVKREDM